MILNLLDFISSVDLFPPANWGVVSGVMYFSRWVWSMKVNTMRQCSSARCTGRAQASADTAPASQHWVTNSQCLLWRLNLWSSKQLLRQFYQWIFFDNRNSYLQHKFWRQYWYSYTKSYSIFRSLPMINADISTDDNYNIVFCPAKYLDIISYWCGCQCYLELRVRVPVLMLIYCDN